MYIENFRERLRENREHFKTVYSRRRKTEVNSVEIFLYIFLSIAVVLGIIILVLFFIETKKIRSNIAGVSKCNASSTNPSSFSNSSPRNVVKTVRNPFRKTPNYNIYDPRSFAYPI